MFDTQKHGRVSIGTMEASCPIFHLSWAMGNPRRQWWRKHFPRTDGILVTDTYSPNPRLLPSIPHGWFCTSTPTLKRVTTSHQGNWVEAILNGAKLLPLSLTEVLFNWGGVDGNLAIKAYQYKALKEGKQMGDWDPVRLSRAQDHFMGRTKHESDQLGKRPTRWVKRDYRAGWEL